MKMLLSNAICLRFAKRHSSSDYYWAEWDHKITHTQYTAVPIVSSIDFVLTIWIHYQHCVDSSSINKFFPLPPSVSLNSIHSLYPSHPLLSVPPSFVLWLASLSLCFSVLCCVWMEKRSSPDPAEPLQGAGPVAGVSVAKTKGVEGEEAAYAVSNKLFRCASVRHWLTLAYREELYHVLWLTGPLVSRGKVKCWCYSLGILHKQGVNCALQIDISKQFSAKWRLITVYMFC